MLSLFITVFPVGPTSSISTFMLSVTLPTNIQLIVAACQSCTIDISRLVSISASVYVSVSIEFYHLTSGHDFVVLEPDIWVCGVLDLIGMTREKREKGMCW